MTAQEIKDAVWAAKLHIETGTMLSDAAVRNICQVLSDVAPGFLPRGVELPQLKVKP